MKRELKIAEKSRLWFSIMAVLLLVSLGSLIIQGLNYGIDFVGGTIITIDLHQKFDTADVRKITDEYDKEATITYSGDNQETLIMSTKKNMSTQERAQIFNAFKNKYVLQDSDMISVDTVSPSVGSEMTRSAIIAVIVAVLLMLIYISIRFEFYYGVAAICGLIFDILVVLGFYSLFRIQVNTPFIAAILTILGYGINDTIVVFDRIRENHELSPQMGLDRLVDVSSGQTIKRSIYTSVTTLLAIVSLYIFGVSEIQSFALPIIVGVVASTYASLCVATPVWLALRKKFPEIKKKKKTTVSKKNNQPVV